jgi:hypothetical protein
MDRDIAVGGIGRGPAAASVALTVMPPKVVMERVR